MEDLITNADDVDVYITEVSDEVVNLIQTPYRVKANEFTITVDQDVGSSGTVGQNAPAGLTRGDLEYSFEFNIEGDDGGLQRVVSDNIGNSLPFSFRAEKPNLPDTEGGGWTYYFGTSLAETEEISGTSGEALGLSVEGMSTSLNKEGTFE